MTAVVGGTYNRFALQDGALATGNGTVFDVGHFSHLLLQVTIAGTATVTPEMSADNSTFVGVLAVNAATGAVGLTITATGHYYVMVAGVQGFRARISSWSSGAVDVDATALYGAITLPSAVSTSGGQTVDTELPTAAALADNTANPTVPGVGAYLMGYDSSTWDRVRLSAGLTASGQGILVAPEYEVVGINDAASNTIALWSANGITATQLVYNMAYNGSSWDRHRSVANSTNSTGTGISAAGLVAQFDDTSPTAITENSFGNVRMSVTHDLRTSYPVPEASAVISPDTFQDFGSVTKDTVKASAGNVFSVVVSNANAALRYFQLHNKASDPAAAETPVLSFPVPAGTAAAPTVLILGVDVFAPSLRLSTGVGWAWSTTDGEFTDSATASDHQTIVRYK